MRVALKSCAKRSRYFGSAPFHVTARTDARAACGLDDALTRARAFADAGADAVFVEAPESVDEMTRMVGQGYGIIKFKVGVDGAADVGSAVRGAAIDLWFPTLAQARAWGRRTVTVTVH